LKLKRKIDGQGAVDLIFRSKNKEKCPYLIRTARRHARKAAHRVRVSDMAGRERLLELRVATGTPDQKLASGIWRIWQGKNNNDIYVAPRRFIGLCTTGRTGLLAASGFLPHVGIEEVFRRVAMQQSRVKSS
jgi:hypothetical protein